MKRNHGLLTVLIISHIFVFGPNLLFGQNAEDFEYQHSNKSVTITGYKGNSKTVTIPGTIRGLPVTKIGYQAFAYKQLISVSLPDSVKEIDTGAFYNNRLTGVTLPESLVSIGDIAFAYNKINDLVIPDSVKVIGVEAFSENRLTNIVLPHDVDLYYNSFYLALYDAYERNERIKSAYSITIIISRQYEIAILNDSVVEILEYYGNEQELIIPERINGLPVISIGNRVFSNRHLASVVIPNSVQLIGDDAFIHNDLTRVAFPNSVRIIGNGTFIDNDIVDLVLPDHIIYIGNAAFASNKISELILPESLISIGVSAFSSNSLTKVTVPRSLKSIGEHAFDSSVKLKKPNFFINSDDFYNAYFAF